MNWLSGNKIAAEIPNRIGFGDQLSELTSTQLTWRLKHMIKYVHILIPLMASLDSFDFGRVSGRYLKS